MRMSNDMKVCCFTGPRLHKLNFRNGEEGAECTNLKNKILKETETAYNRGCREFICGMAEGSDVFFAEAVITLKQKYKDIILHTVLPYNHNGEDRSEEEKIRFTNIIEQADIKECLKDTYSRGCFYERNRYMVDKSDLIIAVYSSSGGTAYTIKYAVNCEKSIRLIGKV